MSQDTDRRPRNPLFVNLAWATVMVVVLSVVYVLSYPVAIRLMESPSPALYQPVEWLIDNSPLREPMFKWADYWDVGDAVRIMQVVRRMRNEGIHRPNEPGTVATKPGNP